MQTKPCSSMFIILDSLEIFWDPKRLGNPTSLSQPPTSHKSHLLGSGQIHSTLSIVLGDHAMLMTSPIYCILYRNYDCVFISGLSLNLQGFQPYHIVSRLSFFP